MTRIKVLGVVLVSALVYVAALNVVAVVANWCPAMGIPAVLVLVPAVVYGSVRALGAVR